MTPDTRPITILMADDDPDERELARAAFDRGRLMNDLRFVADGVELLDYLHRRNQYADAKLAPRPGLILLDLNLPKLDGRHAFREIKSDPRLQHHPIAMMVVSQAEEDILRTYDLGIDWYLSKPVTYQALIDVVAKMGCHWLEIVERVPPEGHAHG